MKSAKFKLKLLFAFFLLSGIIASCKKSSTTPDPNATGEVLSAPVIKSFSAYSGNVGDTIWIFGKNFSKDAKNNIVQFGNVTATAILSKTNSIPIFNDSLKVIVPAGAVTNALNLNVLSKSVTAKDTFWVTTGKWIKRASCPSGGRFSGAAFAIGSKGYVGLGTGVSASGSYLKDFWEYDINLDQWTRKADYPTMIRECSSFVIGNLGYVGIGTNTTTFLPNTTLYAYDPTTNTWTNKATSATQETVDAVGLVAANKGYIITGFYSKQFFVYDPTLNAWSQKADFPGAERSAASGFVINDELYVGGGNSGFSAGYSDLWKYSPVTDKWTQLSGAFAAGYPAVGFSLNGKGYRLLSYGGKGSAFYEYDPTKDQWAMKKAFPGIAYGYQLGFVANGRAFITCGLIPNGYSAETWEFVP